MKASDAHQLKVGDWCRATFGGRGNVKACEIIDIRWPTFTLRTKDHKGREMIRTRRYRGILKQCQPVAPPSISVPAWLEFSDAARGGGTTAALPR